MGAFAVVRHAWQSFATMRPRKNPASKSASFSPAQKTRIPHYDVRMKSKDLYESIVQLLTYDPETGSIAWRVRGASRRLSKVAGNARKDGYIDLDITVDGVRIRPKAHRIAWLLHYGQWPEGVIDHINGVRNDNRIANLRDVTHKVNMENRSPIAPCNKTNLLGVVTLPDGRGFRSLISTDGKEIHLGVFDTAAEAHAAYLGAKKVLHTGFVEAGSWLTSAN